MGSKASAAEAEASGVEPQTITIAEFCMRLSESLRKPELIGAFHSVEVAAGVQRDTAAAFEARFTEFVNKPV